MYIVLKLNFHHIEGRHVCINKASAICFFYVRELENYVEKRAENVNQRKKKSNVRVRLTLDEFFATFVSVGSVYEENR